MKITIEELSKLAKSLILRNGYDDEESEIIFDSLLWSHLRGTSQGFSKLFGWNFAKNPLAKSPEIINSGDNFLLIDSQLNNHIVACQMAINKIIESKPKSIFVAGIKNTKTSSGALGFYTEQLAKKDLVGIILSAADPGVSIYGGKEPVLGTNPISISVPAEPNPILFDMSTASLTWGDLIKHEQENKKLPVGSAFDAEGNPTVEPKQAMEGFVGTFANSYKSSGLSLMIQILAGPLVGSIYSKDYEKCQYGSLIIAINPEIFGDKKIFLDNITRMIDEIKNSKKQEGFNEILLPGERGYRQSKLADDSGYLNVSDQLYQKIQDFLKA